MSWLFMSVLLGMLCGALLDMGFFRTFPVPFWLGPTWHPTPGMPVSICCKSPHCLLSPGPGISRIFSSVMSPALKAAQENPTVRSSAHTLAKKTKLLRKNIQHCPVGLLQCHYPWEQGSKRILILKHTGHFNRQQNVKPKWQIFKITTLHLDFI